MLKGQAENWGGRKSGGEGKEKRPSFVGVEPPKKGDNQNMPLIHPTFCKSLQLGIRFVFPSRETVESFCGVQQIAPKSQGRQDIIRLGVACQNHHKLDK